MFKDITLGQYYPAQSVIHDLDPRSKLVFTLVYLISLFVSDSFWAYGLAAIALLTITAAAHINFRYMLRGVRGILILLMISVLFNLFLTPGDPIISFWFIKISKEGLIQAGKMAVRLLLLVMGSGILTYTTTPTALTDGLEQGLGFLKKLRVPVHEIAMMMSIALRFLPILVEETDKITKAQTARGADFESGNLIDRAKAMIPVLVPLFVSAFRRAGDLALAMEARCYRGGEGRTKMKPLQFAVRDYVFFGTLALYLIAMILL